MHNFYLLNIRLHVTRLRQEADTAMDLYIKVERSVKVFANKMLLKKFESKKE